MTEQAETLLAFDYGEKHIGVAVGQTLTGTANPLGTLQMSGARPDWEAVARLVSEWRPDALVVGLPLNMDGTEQAVTARARRFAGELGERFTLQVHMVDERLSTREARDRLAAAGRAGGEDHPVAAQVILEGFLNDQRVSP